MQPWALRRGECMIAWAIVTLCTELFRSDVLFAVFHFPKFLSSPSRTGMGSGGSAGKEAGPLKALLRQQTQSALEQRVRKRHIHMHLYIHNIQYLYIQFMHKSGTGDYKNDVSPLCHSLTGFQGVSSSSEAFVRTGVCLERACRMFSDRRIFHVSQTPPCLRTLNWKTRSSSTVLMTVLHYQTNDTSVLWLLVWGSCGYAPISIENILDTLRKLLGSSHVYLYVTVLMWTWSRGKMSCK